MYNKYFIIRKYTEINIHYRPYEVIGHTVYVEHEYKIITKVFKLFLNVSNLVVNSVALWQLSTFSRKFKVSNIIV